MANRNMTQFKNNIADALTLRLSKRAKNLGVAVCLLLASSNVHALGLGSLNIASNLDQALQGTIELRVAQGDDLDTLIATIASREDFESLGVDYPSYLKDFSISLDNVSDKYFLRVTSNNIIIKEPFIHFLVRVQWSGGSFLREYTALIDPPVYASESPASISEPKEVGIDQSYQSESSTITAEGQTPALSDDEVASRDVFYNDPPENSDETLSSDGYSTEEQGSDAIYGPVQNGESLSVIAQDLQSQFPDLSMYQIMMVLFEENKSSFIGENINGLMKGSILKIGDLSAIQAVDIEQSRIFYTEQIEEWDPQLLVSSTGNSLNIGQDNYNFQNDSSALTTDSSESDNLSDQNGLFQVGGSVESEDYVSSDQDASRNGEVLALRQEVTSLKSSLESSDLEKQELNERISLLEGQLSDMNRLANLSLESTDLANLETALAEQNNATLDAVDLSDSASNDTEIIDDFLVGSEDGIVNDINDAVDSAEIDDVSLNELATNDLNELDDVEGADGIIDVVQSDVVDVPVKMEPLRVNSIQEKSLLDKITSFLFDGGLWKILAGFLGVLLAGGAGLLFLRRRRADEEFEISMLSIESNSHSAGDSEGLDGSDSLSASHTASTASEATSVDKETSFLTVYSDSDAVVQADEVDPVAEADVYIAYGRDEQAEEVLLDGIVSHPERVDIKQKLLALYHKRQNAEGFERVAEELYSQRAALTGDIWKKTCEMGKEVSPSNPLFDLSGDDLNTAFEVDLGEPTDDIEAPEPLAELSTEPSVEFSTETISTETGKDSPEDDVLDFSAVDDEMVNLDEDLVDPLDTEPMSSIDSVEVVDNESELIIDSLTSDDSIRLINFDDGRSEISELDDVEIDVLEFGDDAPDLITSPTDDVIEIKDEGEVVVLDDENVLDFDVGELLLEPQEESLESSFNDVSEVSGLEIDPDYDEARTQYELAKVFVDLGDEDGASKILLDIVGNEETSADVLHDSKALLKEITS